MARIPLDRANRTPLSEQIASHVQQLIDNGTMPSGSRLPSVRRASTMFGVSPGTIVDAYRVLQHRGRIQPRPQSGYFVRDHRVRPAEEPRPTRPRLRIHDVPHRLAERLHAHARADNMIALGMAQPDRSLMPVEALTRQLHRSMRDGPARTIDYGPTEGTAELRTEIARRMLDTGCLVRPDEIVITNGATEAMYLALKATTRPGDVVAVDSPTYHGILDILCALDLRALPISTCSIDGISVPDLERALQTRRVAALVLVASFTNPLGGCLSDHGRARVAALARTHHITVIEDDVYGDLAFDGCHPPAIRSFDDTGRVIYCASFTKTLAPGFRVGWCVPGPAGDEVRRLKRKMNVATGVPQQLAIARYLATGGYARHIRKVQRAYMERTGLMIDHVSVSFPEGTRISRPLGGSVIWIELPDRFDALRLFEDAEALGISIAPGPLFTPDDAYRNCVRLNCANPWTTQIASAVSRLGMLLKEQDDDHTTGRKRARRAPVHA
jgi:DNA-binding transcriptional MocR family regulator